MNADAEKEIDRILNYAVPVNFAACLREAMRFAYMDAAQQCRGLIQIGYSDRPAIAAANMAVANCIEAIESRAK